MLVALMSLHRNTKQNTLQNTATSATKYLPLKKHFANDSSAYIYRATNLDKTTPEQSGEHTIEMFIVRNISNNMRI